MDLEDRLVFHQKRRKKISQTKVMEDKLGNQMNTASFSSLVLIELRKASVASSDEEQAIDADYAASCLALPCTCEPPLL